ncbi:MAG: sulfatase [Fimbriimonadaceae bacterium]|nr:sulfatase [Fimbriimonadaceae bacterium]
MRRPNVILWTVHGLGTTCGPYGDRTVATPHLDRLAAEGVLGEQHFATCPLGSPARGSIQTGRYPHVNGLMGLVNQGWDLPAGERCLVQWLAGEGYHTALCGLQQIRRETASLGYHEVPPATRAAACAEQAALFLAQPREQPWYLEIGTFEAHRRWDEPDGSVDPATVRVPPIWPDSPLVRQDLVGLYQHLGAIDAALGRVLAALEASGRDADTLLIFTADHGIPFPRCQATLYDSGLRTALLARWPGHLPAGRRVRPLSSQIDLAPTVLDCCGLARPRGLDGRSLRGLWEGRTTQHRQWIFAEQDWHDDYDPQRAVRTERWKYLRNLRPGPLLTLPGDLLPEHCGTARALANRYLVARPAEELYDLHEDPWEQHNLAAEPTSEPTMRELRAMLDEWMESTGDPFTEQGYTPAPARNWQASQRGRQWWAGAEGNP